MALGEERVPDGDRGTVLVVDDEPDVAETTMLMLEDRGLDAVAETSPEAALDRVDETVGCVVSDYQMPRMDGLELLDAMEREHEAVGFVLFTGRGSERIASRAIEAGVDDYLQKGKVEQYDRLANSVSRVVERARAERALAKRRKQFEAVFEQAFDGIFILDVADAVIVDANPRACELLDYPYDELVGRPISEVHPEDYEEYLARARELVDADGRGRVESVCYTRTDDVIRSDITAAPIEYDGREFLVTVMRPLPSDS
ncbi:response regulator [Halorubellus sp. PRR65]|uniref:response regulator n=1 Tax=Halorubellus sp. PRR65 TaxID=3098148 RepID=UPI002B258B7C|nr:response regulator [Halorubellus sp. PRR65]